MTGPDIVAVVVAVVVELLAAVLVTVETAIGRVSRARAEEMLDELVNRAFLGPFRGEPAVDRERLVDVLVGLGKVAQEDPTVRSIDVNPLIVANGVPIAVDALIEVEA